MSNYSFTAEDRIDARFTTPNDVFIEATLHPRDNLTTVSGADTQLALYKILIPLLGTLIIVTNLAVVLSSGLLLKKGVQPRTTYLFLGNVALADLVTGVAVIFGHYYPKTTRTHFTCLIQLGLIVSSTMASIYSVGLIAIDRFLYIVHGLKYQKWIYPNRARFFICITWTIGIVIGFMPAVGWSGSTNDGKICWLIKLAPPGLILLITIVGLLPILLVVILYGIILYHAIKQVIRLRRADLEHDAPSESCRKRTGGIRIFRGKNNVSGQRQNQKSASTRNKPSKVKAVKVVLFTCGSFVVTWIPYFVACSIYVFCDEETHDSCKSLRVAIASPLAILGFFNSLLNPVIYAWWHNGFRTFLRRILCKDSGIGKHSSSGTKTSSTIQNTDSNKQQSVEQGQSPVSLHGNGL